MLEDERRLLDQIETPVFAITRGSDGEPRFAAFNRSARDRLGREEHEILGKTAIELFGGRLGRFAYDNHAAALESGEPRSYELTLPLRGEERLLHTTLAPSLSPLGTHLRVIGTTIDLTGEQALRQLQTEADTMNAEVENYINLAAHDLRTPMRHLKSIANMLREDGGNLSKGQRELIDMLEELGEKSMRLIGEVLSNAHSAAVGERVTEFDFANLVREIAVLLDPGQQANITCPEVRIRADRTAIQIVLRNLIDNALKHAVPEAGSRVRLEIDMNDCDDGFLEIEVRDNGKGFSRPALLFLKGGELRAESGYGLVGVLRLVRARGGNIMVRAAEGGEGAIVAFTMPGKIRVLKSDFVAA